MNYDVLKRRLVSVNLYSTLLQWSSRLGNFYYTNQVVEIRNNLIAVELIHKLHTCKHEYDANIVIAIDLTQ